jgi:hypothetical protein
MSFDATVFDLLSAGITDLVDDRIYPVGTSLQGKTLPAVTYGRVSTRRVRSHGGTSLVEPLYQITCWDATPGGAREVARAVVEVFEDEIGTALVENTLEGFAPAQKLSQVVVDVRLVAGLEEEVRTVS